MARPKRPLIIVQTNPEEISKGGLITISARLFDPNTNQPMTVSRIYMTIINQNNGDVVWPLEVIRKNTDRFDIQIGTDAMKEGESYFLRVSNNWNLSPNGAATFRIAKDGTIPVLIPPLAVPTTVSLNVLLKEFLEKRQTDFELEDILRLKFPTLSDKDIEKLKELIKEKAEKERQPIDDLTKREVLKFIFRTQMDHRVCPICKENENQEYSPNESKPTIPRHFNCRCTYDVIFKEVDKTFEASFVEVAEVVGAAKKYREVQERDSTMLKLIQVVEELD